MNSTQLSNLIDHLVVSVGDYTGFYRLLCPTSFANALLRRPRSLNCNRFGVFFDLFLFMSDNFLSEFSVSYMFSDASATFVANNKTWIGNLVSLMNGKANFTAPYYTFNEERASVVDFINTPMCTSKEAILVNPRLDNSITQFEAIPRATMLLLLLASQLIISAIIATANVLHYNASKRLTYFCAALSDATYSLSFLQKRRSLWNSVPKKIAITTWSVMNSMILTHLVKSQFIRSLTAVRERPIQSNGGIAEMLNEHRYTLVLTKAYHFSENVMFDDNTLLHRALKTNPAVITDTQSDGIAYMNSHPGTIARAATLSVPHYKNSLKNLRIYEIIPSADYFMGTAVSKDSSPFLKNVVTNAHVSMGQYGFTTKILKSYDYQRLDVSKNNNRYPLPASVQLSVYHILFMLTGIGLACATLMIELIFRKLGILIHSM